MTVVRLGIHARERNQGKSHTGCSTRVPAAELPEILVPTKTPSQTS